MSHLLVCGTAISRLHADLIVVRLKQVGVKTNGISLMHTPSMRPNSAVCWLQGGASSQLSSGESVCVSGHDGSWLAESLKKTGSIALFDQLRRLGMSRNQSSNVEDSILENRIIVLAEVHDRSDLSAIIHTFRGLATEKVYTVKIKLPAHASDNSNKQTSEVLLATGVFLPTAVA